MGIKKAVLLAGMSLLVAASALPVSASAAEWTHEGKPVTKHLEIPLSGVASFGTGVGGYACKAHATLTTTGGKTGQVTKLETTTATCKGTGFLENCLPETDTPVKLPWTVEVKTNDLLLKDYTLNMTYDELCPVETVELNIPELTIELDAPNAITTLTPSGVGTAKVNGTPITGVAGGEFTITGGAAGTYAIG